MVERIDRLKWETEPDLAEEEILKNEQRWGCRALNAIKALAQVGGFEGHDAQDY